MTTAIPEERRKAYLNKAFQLNPVWESHKVLELRRRMFGLARHDTIQEATVPVADSRELGARREIVRRQIATIQSEFWKLPIDQLQRSLSAIDIQSVPEFAPAVNRLKTTAACRGEFPSLAQLPGMDMPLFAAFKSAVVLPPAEAGRVRDRFVSTIVDRKRLKQVQFAVRVIEKKYPILYALERDWFATLGKLKKARQVASREEARSSGGGGFSFEIPWFAWWGVFVLIKLLAYGLIRH